MRFKKLLISTTLVLFSFLFLNAQPVKNHGKLSVDGRYMVNEKGEPTVLRGVSYGWHNWWPRFYNKETVKWLADDWKCTVVRAAMGVGPQGSYIDKKEWSKEKIEAVINGAIDAGIYVIIDWHSHEIHEKEAVAFFSEMAEKYGDYPNVIYEIFNEPVHDSWEDVKAYSIEVIKAIRKMDPDNIVLVGCPHWDQDIHLVADDPITGFDNIMYTLHFYAATHKKELRDRGDYAIKKGIPIFVSESAAMKANGDGDLDYKSWNKWIDWMEANTISWITWSIADKNESCSMLKKSAADTGNWSESDLKESGIETRKKLRSFED